MCENTKRKVRRDMKHLFIINPVAGGTNRSTEIYEKVRPEVWVNGTPGKAKNAWPIQIPLKKKMLGHLL